MSKIKWGFGEGKNIWKEFSKYLENTEEAGKAKFWNITGKSNVAEMKIQYKGTLKIKKVYILQFISNLKNNCDLVQTNFFDKFNFKFF